ncbi:MAG: sigma-70 family RNA polymerase sigma factor [Roseiflexaceae bacterium]|nr:sigma-70 family RNA polymerase sigma factor [Roseiflexaceae bacterium]
MYLHHANSPATWRSTDAAFQRETARPAEMELAVLAQRCAAESERFYRGTPHDTAYAYELFRRALVEQSEAAWEYIYGHYAPLVESWVRRCGAFAQTGESSEFFVASAFTKFWRAMRSKSFTAFPNLPALLHYLQLCTSCVVIDSVRAQSWAEVLPEEALATTADTRTGPDEAVLDRAERAEIWSCVHALVNDPGELVILHESFVLGMKPGDIFARHPDLFSTITVVYNTKRNLLERLGRNQRLRQIVGI